MLRLFDFVADVCECFTEETASAQAGALYKPMAKISATVMEEKIKTELAAPKVVCIQF